MNFALCYNINLLNNLLCLSIYLWKNLSADFLDVLILRISLNW